MIMLLHNEKGSHGHWDSFEVDNQVIAGKPAKRLLKHNLLDY